MNSKCFVPSCKNNMGIAFPDDPELKAKWLEILGIQHLKPKPTSFVCLDHFQDDENVDEPPNNDVGKISNNLKQGYNIKTIKEKNLDSGEIELDNNDENGSKNVQAENSEIPIDTNSEICRLCTEHKENLKNIFVEEIEDNIPIVFAILACIHPIEISYEDNLPKNICSDCLKILQVCFKFRSVCLKNDKIQKQTKKRKIDEFVNDNKKKFKNVDDNYDELEAINEFLVKKDVVEKVVIGDKSMNQMEDELRKVLEGSLSEEQAGADNIIIHIENDDDDDDDINDDDDDDEVPIVMKKSPKLKQKDNEIVLCNKNKKIDDAGDIFNGITISYFYDVEFCQVDDYLFEYRLCKQHERYMRCLLPSCSSTAVQNRLENWTFSNEIKLIKSHNHKCPTESEKKKQMFFYIMKRKMHSDKTLKFKNVYDDICQKDPEIKQLIPLRNVINEICRHQFNHKLIPMTSFDSLFNHIEDDAYQKFQFTLEGKQFYQEKFVAEENAKAIVFANLDTIDEMSDSDLMYIDASFRIETSESFSYQLVTVLVWVDDSYYPIMFALVNYKTQEIYKKIFEYLHNILAPRLRPDEIITEYESNLYYALGEIYIDSSIGGSVFYYTQNIYKKICLLNLSKNLETNTYFRNIYHMLLMLPLLPVNTILDGFNNIKAQADQMGIENLTKCLFNHIDTEWLKKVTPDLFCVHRLENRINENVIAPFKKLRDYIMLSKGKGHNKSIPDVMIVIEKLIELEHFLHATYSSDNKRSFSRDLSSAQKKNVLRAWQFIETHPKININNFFSRVLGYIKCMENQLWIWGFYRYSGDVTDELINAANFSIVSTDLVDEDEEGEEDVEGNEEDVENDETSSQIVMEAVLDESGGFVLQRKNVSIK